jgi:uncharacterized membrane protein
MRTSRLEAFSDGVMAIIITIMVLELRVPEEPTWEALVPSGTGLLTYLLSFVYVGIYWNNHHHFFQVVTRVSGLTLWANLHLLFWLSLLPFTTAWMDETDFATLPTMLYGIDLLLCAIAWFLLQQAVFRTKGEALGVRQVVGRDLKGKASPVLYVAGILLCLLSPWLGLALYVVVALLWLVPDRRFARHAELQHPATD